MSKSLIFENSLRDFNKYIYPQGSWHRSTVLLNFSRQSSSFWRHFLVHYVKHFSNILKYGCITVKLFFRFCLMCDEFPINLKFTNCFCKSKHGYRLLLQNIQVWKACWPSHKYFLARKEKFVLPPYFKEVY